MNENPAAGAGKKGTFCLIGLASSSVLKKKPGPLSL
jgi:hypothetical protein